MGHGFDPGRSQLFGLDAGQYRDLVSLASVTPSLNEYLEKSGEGKQEGCAKAQDGWPPAPHRTSWLKGHETEISTVGLDLKVLVSSYLLLTYYFVTSHWYHIGCR
jgi:hypothetical protein